MAKSFARLSEEALLSDAEVETLVEQLAPVHRLFLAGLGRGLSPAASAKRAGWTEAEADRIADVYMTAHPIVSRLAGHVVRLRELATMDGEEPLFESSSSVH